MTRTRGAPVAKAAQRQRKPLSEELIRGCYWLAHFYGVSPTHFLRQSEARIRQHMKYSTLLYTRIMQQEQRAPKRRTAKRRAGRRKK
jgi:hypothetical protein